MEGYKILSIEAKDLVSAMLSVVRKDDAAEYSVRCTDGRVNLRKFTNTLDYSLDTMKLKQVYEDVYGAPTFAFKSGRHLYTQSVICVTFKYSYKEFNKAGKNTYIRNGYAYRDCEFKDGVCFAGDQLIGIQTNVEIKHPVNNSLLAPYFAYDGSCYVQKKNFKTLMDKSELRRYLYTNGFRCDGINYVRYKRSAGSSRVGKCLFVNQDLASQMAKWDRCGLNLKEGDQIDLAGFESYISLTMSSVIGTLDIPLESILVIDDYESVFTEEVVAVEIENDHLVSSQKVVEIKNSIWDGQSLMDVSLFADYPGKGMLLLRNQFFKSCCFNTNLQKWFADNGITDVYQLNGKTRATSIDQIKLITTPSSIKYLKFGSLNQWLDNVEPTFGVVKYDKPTHYMDGRMVQSHYQLFNTLRLTYYQMEEVLQPSIDYIRAIRSDPSVLRYAINYPEDVDDEIECALNTRNEIIFKMLGINDNFARTKMYYDFRDDLVRGKIRKLKQGHVLINGNYSTMMGNGLEMLKAACSMFDGHSEVGVGNIHTRRFAYGTDLLCSRSPHVCSGNIMIAHNVEHEIIDEYFNLTPEIVCVNAINENIQERLNGCDYDSDTILITDHPLLVEVAKRHYHDFKVPTNMTTAQKIKRHYTVADKADLDIKTSMNYIGTDINLSQQLNSLMWHRINHGETIDSQQELYQDICKLAVLSNLEIDRAKREYSVNTNEEITAIKNKYLIVEDGKTIKPMFFTTITTENGYNLSNKIHYKYFDTAMDYLQKVVKSINFRKGRADKLDVIPFMSMIREPAYVAQGSYYSRKKEIMRIVQESRDEIKKAYINFDSLKPEERVSVRAQICDMKQDCIDRVTDRCKSPAVMYLTLKELDAPGSADVSRYMFETLFKSLNTTFFKLLKYSNETIFSLQESEDGDIELYGFKFKKVPLERNSKYANVSEETDGHLFASKSR